MRNLVLILIAFLAVVTFIRAYDDVGHGQPVFAGGIESGPILNP